MRFLVALFLSTGVYDTWTPARTGITWRHDNALSARRYLPESIGPGVAIFDFDRDGWMDLFFPNSGPCDFFQPPNPLQPVLYRNNHDGTFSDLTARAGFGPMQFFSTGVAAADYDNDGDVDLLVTGYPRNALYRNNGDGTFADVTRQSGLAALGIYTSAVWFDYDNNGTIDLYIGHFVRYSKEREPECKTDGVYHYCYPLSYEPWPSRMYRNNGSGTFEDVSEKSGIGKFPGKAFGAVAVDLNDDGFLDLFVANDSVPNFLFINKGDGTFAEKGLEAGVAYSGDGIARSGMGVDAADYDGDGRPDLFVANFNRERFSLYRNLGKLNFSDVAGPTGIGSHTYMYSGWGIRFLDFDNDSDLDLVMCNGHPDDLIETVQSSFKHKEPLLLLENRAGKFVNLGAAAGDAFARDYPARGLAVGDLDNDGWPDIVVGNNGEGPLVLRHRGGSNRWVGIDEVRAGAIVRWPGGQRFVSAGGSYLSSQDPRVVIGLGTQDSLDWVEIIERGHARKLENLKAGKYYR